MVFSVTILSLLLTLQVKKASASRITLMGVADSPFVVRKTAAEVISSPFGTLPLPLTWSGRSSTFVSIAHHGPYQG